MNNGFIKVNVEDAPESFVSYDEDAITGYVVDLSIIEYEKLPIGRDYIDLIAGDTIKFNEDDVFVYDATGTVYYAKGSISESGDVYYTDDEKARVEGPEVEILETVHGNIKIKVTPANGGSISSVTVGSKKATSADGSIFNARVTSNGSYIVLAKEEGGGATRIVISINDIEEVADGLPVVNSVYINDGKEYTNLTTASLYIDADNAEYIAITTNATAPSQTDSVWKEYTSPVNINLTRDGKNTFYVWAKNAIGAVSQYKMAEIIRDTTRPSTDAPSYEINNFSISITPKQTDESELTFEYAYRKKGMTTWTWQKESTINNAEPKAVYEIKTRATDKAGNENESYVVTTDAIMSIPSDIVITVTPEGWSKSKEVLIKYPNTYGNLGYKNLYRINSEDWKEASSDTASIRVAEDAEVYAVVKLSTGAEDFGEVAKVTVTVDIVGPVISNVITEELSDGINIKASVQDTKSGLVAYTVTGTDEEPAYWANKIDKTNEAKDINFKVTENKNYYIWAKDAVGNVSHELVAIDNIDNTDPRIKSCTVNYEKGKAIINATMQDENLGLVAYAVVKGNGVAPTNSDWITIEKTSNEYVMSYSITARGEEDNGYYTIWAKDDSGKTASVVKSVKIWFNVTYDYETNGGTSINISSNVKGQGCLTEIDLTPRATKENSVFVGWNINPSATEGLTSYTVGTSEDVRLYAIFKTEIEVTLVYYNNETKKNDVIPVTILNKDDTANVSIPNITETYKDWTAYGWSTSISNDAEVLYSGENITLETDKDITLYMLYKKNVSATYRYYDYETDTTSSNDGKYLYIEKVADDSYNKYFTTTKLMEGEIKTNAADIENATSFTATIPAIKTNVKYGGNNVWSLRGWSKDAASDAEIKYSSGQTVKLSDNETYYASYETTVKADKYCYGNNLPAQSLTGKATMNYNAVAKPAVIALGKADEVLFKNAVWNADGWAKGADIDSDVIVANGGSASLTEDTNFYAKYEREVSLVTNKYGSAKNVMTASATLSQDGTTKGAKFVLENIPAVSIDGNTWASRGYSLTTAPNATIAATAGTVIETDEDIEYYTSYYKNIKTIKQLLNTRKILAGTAYLGYDGTKLGNTINLGSFDAVSYDEASWNPLYWSTDRAAEVTNSFNINEEVETWEDKTYYAIYDSTTKLTKYSYENEKMVLEGTSVLNASGAIKDAIINLQTGTTLSNVNHNGITWTQSGWITTEDIKDASKVTYSVDKDIETHKDATVYAVYGNTFNAKAYYLGPNAEQKEKTFASTAELTYKGEIINTNETVLPELVDVEKESKTWTPLGYLRRSDGYTIADVDGDVIGNVMNPVKISEDEEFYAIYDTTIEITKVKYQDSEVMRDMLSMNARAQITPAEINIGRAEDITFNDAIWEANGWNEVNEGTDLPSTSLDATVEVTGDATYYASYTRDLNVEFQEYTSEGVTASTFTKIPIFMNTLALVNSYGVQVKNPTRNTVTVGGKTWTFDKWAYSLEATNKDFATIGEYISPSGDLALYAQYQREANVNIYKYNNVLADTLTGNVIMNAIGQKQAGEVLFPELEPVEANGMWECRGFSTGKGATDGSDFVMPGDSDEIIDDMTYYASYEREVSLEIVGYNGKDKEVSVRKGKAYMNYLAEKQVATIILPKNTEYPLWKFVGYTEDFDSLTSDSTYSSRIVKVSEDKTIYTLYERDVTLTYDTNGGTPTPIAQTAKQVINAYLPVVIDISPIRITTDEVLKSGYNFTGEWNTSLDGSGTAYYGNEEIYIEEDTTLYAQFAEKVYNINYDLNGGTGDIPSQQKVADGRISDVIPTREGCEFLGWGISEASTTIVYNPGDAYAVEGDENLFAIWKAKNGGQIITEDSIIISKNTEEYITSLTVTIEHTNAITTLQYNINEGIWIDYKGPFDVTSNCTINARSINSGIVIGTNSMIISNICTHNFTTRTCTEAKRCTVCGYVAEPAFGHDFTAKDTGTTYKATNATCTTAATYYYKCSRCTAKDTSRTYASGSTLGHAWSEWEVTKNPTCQATGSQKRTCSRCSLVETADIAKINHDWGYEHELTAATCTKPAVWGYTCTMCGMRGSTRNYGSAKGHIAGSVKYTTSTHEYTCIECGQTFDKGAHTFVNNKCSVCGYTKS